MRSYLLRLTFVLALSWCASAVAGKIYRWVDPSGGVHYTEDLSQVPPEQRLKAEQQAGEQAKKRSNLQTIKPESQAAPAAEEASAEPATTGKTHRIRVEKTANSMRVTAKLNNSVDVEMIVDTGASMIMIGRSTADALGVTIDSSTPRVPVSTANGMVMQSVVMLDSVQIGTARVENLQALVSDTFGEGGLLGLSFFNHFNYTVDSAQGVITLKENKLGDTGVLKGGRTKEQWANEFLMRQEQLAYIEENMQSGHPQWEYAKDKLEKELEELNAQADQAGVPDNWRY